MQIQEKPTPRVVSNTLEPEISFQFTLSLGPFEALVRIGGELLAPDGTRIAELREAWPTRSNEPQILHARRFGDSAQSGRVSTRSIEMVAALSPKVINCLEDLREKDSKHDLHLQLRLAFRLLESRALLLPTERMAVPTTQRPPQLDYLVVPADQSRWSSSTVNSWLLSGDGSEDYLQMTTRTVEDETLSVRIPATDWLHDFAPDLGIGRFVLAELPAPEDLHVEAELESLMSRAVQAITAMRSELMQGEWGEVIKTSRPFMELMRSPDLWTELRGRLGFPEDALEEFQTAVVALFEFSSKPHHELAKTTGALRDPVIASKEDAELVYALSVAILNLITRRLKKASNS